MPEFINSFPMELRPQVQGWTHYVAALGVPQAKIVSWGTANRAALIELFTAETPVEH